MLVLFDIDLTLITTGGAGIRAMTRAGNLLFGPGFRAEGISYAGRLDPLIMRDMLALSGVAAEESTLARFRRAYAAELPRELSQGGCRALPGVGALLDAVEGEGTFTMGLLTGNFAETGQAKLRACAIDPDRFAIRAWGDESPRRPESRDQLPEVAMARHAARLGRAADPLKVVIIGDTEHDVRCAKVNGCRCIGVGTGRTSADELSRAGADLVLADLSDTEGVLRALRSWA